MNYFDDYYSDSQPEQEPNYIPPKPPKERKERKGLRRFLSIVLVLALVVGSCGVTAALMNQRFEKQMDAFSRQMEDKLSAVQKDMAQQPAGNGNASVGRPLASGEYLTPGQVYQQNVDAVVAITVEVSGYDGRMAVATVEAGNHSITHKKIVTVR